MRAAQGGGPVPAGASLVSPPHPTALPFAHPTHPPQDEASEEEDIIDMSISPAPARAAAPRRGAAAAKQPVSYKEDSGSEEEDASSEDEASDYCPSD